MQLFITPLFQQPAHHHSAFDALGLTVTINNGGFSGIDFKADLSGFVSHVSSLATGKGGNARLGADAATDFDVAIAEMADVEEFSHLGHRHFFWCDLFQQRHQGVPNLVVGLLCFSQRKFADGCLAAPNCFGDLWLRHLAVTLDVGNNVFPVHSESITGLRYSKTANRYLFFVSCGHGN